MSYLDDINPYGGELSPSVAKPDAGTPERPEIIERAKRVIELVGLPRLRDRDQAIDNLFYVDPNHDSTRAHSIAAALWILGVRR